MAVYLFQHEDSILMESSSGGAFQGIVEKFFSQNELCKVYGAVYDESFMVKHKSVDNLLESKEFSTSKYCFSEYDYTLKQVEEDLKTGIKVLYSGLPCQVAALINYLTQRNVPQNNLITVDILCHGAPDKIWWERYIKWLEEKNKAKLKFFSFRWKKAKWRGYSLHAKFDNNIIKTNTHDLQVYMDLFFSHHIMRKSCYKCCFATNVRKSDITLGDFWGVESVMPNVLTKRQIKKGTSLVLGNTEKGCDFLENMYKILKDRVVMMSCNNDGYAKYQTALNEPVHLPENHKQFEVDYNQSGFEYILKKYAGYGLWGKLRFGLKKVANVIGVVDLLR